MRVIRIENRGRPKRSPDTRDEQRRVAQARFRAKMARKGKIPMQAYVRREVVDVVDEDARARRETRGDRVEWALRKCFAAKLAERGAK